MTGREKTLVGTAVFLVAALGLELYSSRTPAPAEALHGVSAPKPRPAGQRRGASAVRPAQRPDEKKAAPPSRTAAASGAAKLPGTSGGTPFLRMDLLASMGEGRVSLTGRNVFAYPPPPPPQPPPPTAQELAAVAWKKKCGEPCPLFYGETYGPPTPPPPPPPPPPAPPPVPPTVNYKFVGEFGPDANPIAMLSDGKAILNVRKGAVVDDKFIVRGISREAVEFGFVGFPENETKRVVLAP